MTDNILVHNVRLEIGRQISAVYQSFSALFNVFEQIADGLHDIVFFYLLEIVSAEVPQKVRVLVRRLHSVLFGTVIADLFQFSNHSVFGDIENPVKVQSLTCGTLPNAYILPALAAYKVLQSIAQRLLKSLFRVKVLRNVF